jgi:hypothetical protein
MESMRIYKEFLKGTLLENAQLDDREKEGIKVDLTKTVCEDWSGM